MRRWIFWLLVLGFIWLMVAQFDELRRLGQTLTQTLIHGRWQWAALAALVMALYYWIYAASFQAALRAVEIERRIAELLPVIFGMFFVNVITPAGGAAGVALFVDDAARRGHSTARTMTGMILQLAADFIGLSLILVGSLAYLFMHRELPFYEIAAAGALFGITVGMSLTLLLGVWLPELLRRLFVGMENITNHLAVVLRLRNTVSAGWGRKFADEMIGASQAIARYPQRAGWTMLLMLAAHLLAMLALYMLFLAFYGGVELGALAAGYTVGILFWIISPILQGVGVVESAMTLTFVSLGVQITAAVAVILVFRGLIFWIPVFLGFILLRQIRSFSPESKQTRPSQSWRLPAILFAGMGLVNLIRAAQAEPHPFLGMMGKHSPLLFEQPGRLFGCLFGAALLLLAAGLWRGKRYAWRATLLLSGVAAVASLTQSNGIWRLTVLTALIIWLLLIRRRFVAGSDPVYVRQGALVWAGLLSMGAFLGVAGFSLVDSSGAGLNQAANLGRVLIMLTLFYDPAVNGGSGSFLSSLIYVCGAAAWSSLFWALDQPVQIRRPSEETERRRAGEIVQRYGRTSQAHLTLMKDKRYFFTPGGSLVAYTVCGRAALTLGDPVGPPEDAPAAIAGFCEYCARNDWLPAFCLTTAEYLGHYRRAGFGFMCLGHEGVIDLHTFTLRGNACKTFRKRYNRLTSLGYRVEIHEPPISAEILQEVRQISHEWLQMAKSPEKRFFLAWFDEDYVRNERLALVRAPDGRITAFTNLVPEYQLSEISIDLMRRRSNIESGSMDFLFVSLFLWARQQGYDTFNLGLSPLFGVGQAPDSSPLERLIHLVYERGSFYDFKGLNAFKIKFRPRWMPQYLVFPGLIGLPLVGLAMAKVNAGEGETLWQYFRNRPKRLPEEDEKAEDLPLLASNPHGD